MTTEFCKCGKEKCRDKNGKIRSTCGGRTCSPRFGIKRPDHAAFMKQLAASGASEKFSATLMKRGELKNPNVNTEQFKKTVLANKGIATDDVEAAHSKLLSENAVSRKVRTKQLVTKFERWSDEFKELARVCCSVENVTTAWLDSLLPVDFDRNFAVLHGIQTSVNMEKHRNTGRNKQYIRVEMHDLKFNMRGITTVLTRSKLESQYIELFESLALQWDYEWITLPKVDNSGVYHPDFLLKYNNEMYIIEVKGDWYHSDKDDYFANKIGAAVNYANENKYLVCVSYIKPKDMSFLTKAHHVTTIRQKELSC